MLLFNLIHKLDGYEKHRFLTKINKDKPAYGVIFKTIVSQKIYNEKLVKTKFAKSGNIKSYAVSKNYLYHAIIRSCIEYNSKNKNKHYYLLAIEFLYGKGLMENVCKMLKQAFKEAEDILDYLTMFKLIEFARRLLNMGIQKKELLYMENKKDEINHQFKANQELYDFLSFLTRTRKKKGGFLNKDEKVEIADLLKEKLSILNLSELDKRNKIFYHEMLFLYGGVVQNNTFMSVHAKELGHIVHTPYFFKILTLSEKIKVLSLLLIYHYEFEQLDLVQEYIDKGLELLDSETEASPMVLTTSKLNFNNFRLLVFLKRKQLSFASEFVNGIGSKNNNNSKFEIPELRHAFEVNKIVLLFLMSDYSRMLKSIDRILIKKRHLMQSEMVSILQLLEMFGALEQKKLGLLESRLIAYSHLIKKNKLKGGMYSLFETFFKHICQGKEINMCAQTFLKDAKKLPLDEGKRMYYFVFDWFKDKANQQG